MSGLGPTPQTSQEVRREDSNNVIKNLFMYLLYLLDLVAILKILELNAFLFFEKVTAVVTSYQGRRLSIHAYLSSKQAAY